MQLVKEPLADNLVSIERRKMEIIEEKKYVESVWNYVNTHNGEQPLCTIVKRVDTIFREKYLRTVS